MTGRERIAQAFGQTGCREAGAVICYEGIFIRDHLDVLSVLPWWYQYSPNIEEQLRWRNDVIASLDQDWFRLPLSYTADERHACRLDARGDLVLLADSRSGIRRRIDRPVVSGWDPGAEAESLRPEELPSSEAEIDQILPSGGTGDAASIVLSGKAELAHRLLKAHGGRLFATYSVSSPFWLCFDIWGFEGMMVTAATNPGLVRYACERLLAQQLDQVRVASALGADGVWIEECLADLLSPAMYAELCLPYLQRLADAIRDRRMKSIHYFCGNPEGKWEMLLDSRADALSLEEGKKGFVIDIERVAERVDGKLVLFGNLDAIGVLQKGSIADLRAEIRRQLRAGERNHGRFVMSTGSPVTPETPLARVRELCRFTRESAPGSQGG